MFNELTVEEVIRPQRDAQRKAIQYLQLLSELPDDTFIPLGVVLLAEGNISKNTFYRKAKDGGLPAPRKVNGTRVAILLGEYRDSRRSRNLPAFDYTARLCA